MKLSWKHLFWTVTLLIATIFPWGIRNYFVLGEFHLSTSGSGQVLWEGNNPWNFSGGPSEKDWGYLQDMPKNLTELQTDRWKKQKALEFIRAHPDRFLELAMKKFIRFWNFLPNAEGYNQGRYKWLSILSFGPVFFLAFASLWILRRVWKKTILIWSFIAYYTVLHMITIGSIRYRLPLEPLLIALAGATLAKLSTRILDVFYPLKDNSLGEK